MRALSTTRALAVGIALASALLLMAAAQAASSSASHSHPTRTLVALRKTGLGTILVDARGRTLYLFEKDRNGMSMCDSACAKFWPRATSHGAPRAGKGVHRSLLRLTRSSSGVRQVTYAGHPLYTFVGDKHAGQTSGEGLDNFGAEWYAVAATGHKVERNGSGSPGSGGSSGGGYGSSGGGW
jgi:predicted lipoprotein with Yx(FWY)xxD motif